MTPEETLDTEKARHGTILDNPLNTPNLLTILRIALIPLVLWFLSDGTPRSNIWAALIYVGCAVTDALDGWLARTQGQVGMLGKFLDPLADKLLIMATLVFFVDTNRVPAWLVVLVIARELTITTLRTLAIGEGIVMDARQGGKEKTALQMVSILLLVLYYPYDLNFLFIHIRVNLGQAGLVLLYLSTVLAFTSAVEYVVVFIRTVRAKSRSH